MKENKVDGTCGTHGRGEESRVLVGKPEGKRLLGRPRRRWEDGIRMDYREIGWRVYSGSSWLRIGYHDEPADSGATELVS
jgi:hypothetical protein